MRKWPARGRIDALMSGIVALAVSLTAGCGGHEGPASAPGGSTQRAGSQGGDAAPAAQAPLRFAGLEELRAELETRRRAGRPVLLNFWATWCEPCIAELPDLEELAREWSQGGPEIIGVSLDGWVYADEREVESKVREMLARTGVTFANLIYRGEQDPLLDGLHMPGPIPFSILYDREGKRVADYVGPIVIEEVRRDSGDLLKDIGGSPPAGRAGA